MKTSDVIGRAVAEALEAKKDYALLEADDFDAANWFAMYQAQCSATDQFAKAARAKSDAALQARIAELEEQCARLNRRITEANEA